MLRDHCLSLNVVHDPGAARITLERFCVVAPHNYMLRFPFVMQSV